MSEFAHHDDPPSLPSPALLPVPRSLISALPLLVGLAWLALGANSGVIAFLLAAPPGSILVAAGVAGLCWPCDQRVPLIAACGEALALVLVLPQSFVIGIGSTLPVAALSLAAFLVTGMTTLRRMQPVPGVPRAIRSLGLAAKVATDDALFAAASVLFAPLKGDEVSRAGAELDEFLNSMASRGWTEKPSEYHRVPPPLDSPRLERKRAVGYEYEHLSFESGYEPREAEPGRDRWLSRVRNREGHAYVLRHPGPPRPWMVAINGGAMGYPLTDLPTFGLLHKGLGLNLLIPVLPLHGPRNADRLAAFREPMDLVHLEAQAMWDIRRLISWISGEGGTQIGVAGLSLGGYNAALLTTLEPNLQCAIAGIPLTDFSEFMLRFLDRREVEEYDAVGLSRERIAAALRVVSPLAMPTRLPPERLGIFGGVADRVVPPSQVRALVQHWGEPRCEWYQGGHMSVLGAPGVRELSEATLAEGGMLG